MNLDRRYMSLSDLKPSKAQRIAIFSKEGKLYEPNTDELPVSNLAAPGFYFFVHPNGVVYARFYMGRQRSKTGLPNVVSQINRQRTKTGKALKKAAVDFDIYYVSLGYMKPLTNAFGKGPIATKFTRQHSDDYQNIEELNRLLNDNFNFYAQKY